MLVIWFRYLVSVIRNARKCVGQHPNRRCHHGSNEFSFIRARGVVKAAEASPKHDA
jgi:hypothetical protein